MAWCLFSMIRDIFPMNYYMSSQFTQVLYIQLVEYLGGIALFVAFVLICLSSILIRLS